MVPWSTAASFVNTGSALSLFQSRGVISHWHPARSGSRRTAARQFGNVTALKEQTRDMWTFPSFESVVRDLRYALRTLAGRRRHQCEVAGRSRWLGVAPACDVDLMASGEY